MDFERDPADNKRVGTLQRKDAMANLFAPRSLSMAQFSVRGACGFVLTANAEVSRKMEFCPDWRLNRNPQDRTEMGMEMCFALPSTETPHIIPMLKRW
jgi:hypothetical protein